MGFKIPKYLQDRLNNKDRVPLESFVNNSEYYADLNYYWINYMTQVVRPCIAYSNAVVDGVNNSTLSLSTGKAIVDGATRLIRGKKIFFEGNDESCTFLSDIWAPSVNFNLFLSRAIKFMLGGGTSIIKINTDINKKNTLSSSRIDRVIFSNDDGGNVTDAIFFVSLLSSFKNDSENEQYWLVEHRKYNKEFKPVIVYKVFCKSGIANSVSLPSPYSNGIPLRNCSPAIKRELLKLGITKLNTEIPLPYRDGLGVWLCRRTSTNSVVPDAALGDPLLYGLLDLLWSMDVVFSGSLIDVINGEGKILVPKAFLSETMGRLQKMYPGSNFTVTTDELHQYEDESFVYIKTDAFDKEKNTPTPVQFDIRADQYRAMLEMYEKEAAVRSGYSPTSLFPHLTPDGSAKSATEVTAEENMTRSSIEDQHELLLPVINRAIKEVLYQEGFSSSVTVKLSDYIGNKIQFDANLRENYKTGLVPKETAVQQINNLSVFETKEYLKKLKEDETFGTSDFNDSNYFGGINENSEQTIKLGGSDTGRSGESDTIDNQGRVFEQITPPSSYGAITKNNPSIR